MFNKLIINFLLIAFSVSAFAQSQKKIIKYGDKALEEGDYYGASIYYRQAMDIDSTKTDLLYKFATSLRLFNEYELAEQYYERVYKADKGKEFPETLFWLATMKKNNGHYIESKKQFKKVNSKYKKDKGSYFYLKSLKEQESCDYAIKALVNDSITVENLGERVNSIHAEFRPFPVQDKLYFSSLRVGDTITRSIVEKGDEYFIKIYREDTAEIHRKDTLQSTEELEESPEELDSIINSKGFHNANGTFGPDGKEFYFSRCSSGNKCAIYVSKIYEDEFGDPVLLDEQINTPGSTSTQPFLAKMTPEEEVLFFTSDRPGGEGGLDIWYAVLKSGKFSKPVNAGKEINSIEDEIAPFYHAPSRKLYFSSAWHNGLGGLDIFKSQGEPGGFSAPGNLGIPINSSANDVYFFIDSAGTSGYFASNRKGGFSVKGETCCNDIYQFRITEKTFEEDSVPPSVFTTLEELNKYLPVTLYFHNDEPNPRTTDTITFKNYLSCYQDYLALKEKYKKEYSTGLKGEEVGKATDNIESFFEDYVSKGVDDLEMFAGILFKVLREGQQIEVTVKGYASPLAKSDYNLKLTKRRISSLVNYLAEYENGVFLPFLNKEDENGGGVSFVEMPFGSYKADTTVSSNLNDLRNSVYSRAAALERKIEIIAVSVKDSAKIRLDNHQPEKFPDLKIAEDFFDFGKVDYGQVVEHLFKIENTGDTDLIIYNGSGSCGCTVPDWSREPIPPGKEAFIKVKFDSKGKMGKQMNTVTLITNAIPNSTVLTISADVILKK